jgi:hypothetical protein
LHERVARYPSASPAGTARPHAVVGSAKFGELFGCDGLGTTGGAILAAQLYAALETIDEQNALGAVAEVLLEVVAGGGGQLAVEVLGEHREDLGAVAVVHEDRSFERK